MFTLALILIGAGLVLLLAFFVSIAVTRKEEVEDQNDAYHRAGPDLPPWRGRTSAPGGHAQASAHPPARPHVPYTAPKPPISSAPSPQDLVVSGILYLDPARRVRDESARSGDVRPEVLMALTRVGPATLVVQGADFIVHAGNATYRYASSELDQILFVRGGVALITAGASTPIPVFLTEQHDIVKEYVRSRSRAPA